MEKIMLDKEAYVQAVAEYRSRYGYEDMSQDEKIEFDQKLDKVVGIKESEETDQTESTDGDDDTENFRKEMRDKYGYDDMSDEEKADFDGKLDSVLGTNETEQVETMDDEEIDAPVRKLTR